MDHDGAVTIGADDLATRLASDDPPVVLDVRWRLGDDRGHENFREGHVPGAVYVDLDTELAAPADRDRGRHPLPDIGDLLFGFVIRIRDMKLLDLVLLSLCLRFDL